MEEVKELKVSRNTDTKKLAGTIKHYLQRNVTCRLMALGQQPICNCVKAIALLSSMFSVEYQCTISYFHQDTETNTLSGIQFIIESKN